MKAALLAALLLQGCIFVPHTEVAYEPQCKTVSKQWVLKPKEIGYFGNVSCGGSRECAYFLAGIGAVSAATFVVSGSIVVVGNIVHWLEYQGACLTG